MKSSPIPIYPPRNMFQELGRLCRLRRCEGIGLRATKKAEKSTEIGMFYPEKLGKSIIAVEMCSFTQKKMGMVIRICEFYAYKNGDDSWKCVVLPKKPRRLSENENVTKKI